LNTVENDLLKTFVSEWSCLLDSTAFGSTFSRINSLQKDDFSALESKSFVIVAFLKGRPGALNFEYMHCVMPLLMQRPQGDSPSHLVFFLRHSKQLTLRLFILVM
jgi:hypothetical protein